MKKFISVFLTVVMLFSVLSCIGTQVSAEDSLTTSNGFKYKFVDDNKVEVIGYKGKATSIVIPTKIDGKTVVGIAKDWDKLGNNWGKIESVKIPGKINYIDDYAFSDTKKLKKVTIENGVKKIADTAFEACNKITNLKIPASVKIMANDIWQFLCTNAKITVDSKNPYYYSKGGVVYNKKKTILYQYYFKRTATKFVVPDTVKTIYRYSFKNATNLKMVTMNNNVTSIDMAAFEYCKNLHTVKISQKIRSMEPAVFWGCRALKNLPLPKNIKEIPSMAFKGCYGLKKIDLTQYPKLQKIEGQAFEDCINIKGIVKIPKTVTYVGFYAFYNCKKMTGVETYSKLEYILDVALGFYNANGNSTDSEGNTKKIKNFTIYGAKNSAAHEYAKIYGLKFVVK